MNPPFRFIGLFLIIQLLLPLSYYTYRERYDERFAWRMFSPIRSHQCTLDLRFDKTPIPARKLMLHYHEAVLGLLKRARPAVAESIVDELCSSRDLREKLGYGEVTRDVSLTISCGAPGSPKDWEQTWRQASCQ